MAYAVEAWWLGNLVKAGKLDLDTYIDLASKVTVDFARRLAGRCKSSCAPRAPGCCAEGWPTPNGPFPASAPNNDVRRCRGWLRYVSTETVYFVISSFCEKVTGNQNLQEFLSYFYEAATPAPTN